jgi:hypothetical protein
MYEGLPSRAKFLTITPTDVASPSGVLRESEEWGNRSVGEHVPNAIGKEEKNVDTTKARLLAHTPILPYAPGAS